MTLPDVAQGDPHVAAHNNERHLLNAVQTLTDATFVGKLSSSYATVSDSDGAPLTDQRVRVVVDRFGDIDDIIVETN